MPALSSPLYPGNVRTLFTKPYLSNTANISATRHQLSRRFDYPIINLTREAFSGPEAAEVLIRKLRLTDSANTQTWPERIREAFSGGHD